MQENMKYMCSKLLAETRKAETMNNSGQVENTLQPLTVQSDTGICIQEVHSEKTSVFPHLEEDCLSLQDWEVSHIETGDTISPLTNNVVSQSENEGNAEIVDSENLPERNSDVECNMSAKKLTDKNTTNGSLFGDGLSFPYLAAIDAVAQSFQDWKIWYFEDWEVS
ncbi:unnamed protein product [Clavelina lepadiformis]|uniref:Uncharacterized protein n=1 Tax=Clavelina lepadiformis TaxID=159417 RepID=A0ABP0G794_CLALP